MHEMCNRCCGAHKLIFGALLLLNAFVWPRWLGIDGWVAFLAVLMVLGGFLKLVMPSCSRCVSGACIPSKPASKVASKTKQRKR